ncbi:MAG: hypothetical protein BWZ04_03122 [Firmicutes bacterium ADurb.BinA205]|nr:MAG: hypothetical protein BWZ04_03122 [Firmicutes bacterium ADurb.BinA205]
MIFHMNTRQRRMTSTPSDTRIRVLRSILQTLCGLLIYSFGVYLTIAANIGLAPWDCFCMGISQYTPLNYGSTMVLVSVAAILIQLLFQERIGFATILDALITGRLTQLFIDISPYPENHSTLLGIVLLLFGFLIIDLGIYVYMSAELGSGPKDGLMIVMGKKLPKIPIGIIGILLWSAVTLTGWLLGGSVGIGTLLSIFGAGFIMHIFYDAIGFEPRKLKHKSLKETIKMLHHSD